MLSHTCSTKNDALMMTDDIAQSAEQLLAETWRHVRLKSIEQANNLCARLCTNYADFAPAWHAASVIAMLQGQNPKALAHIQHALTLQPNHSQWALHQGGLLMKTNQRTAACTVALGLVDTEQAPAAFWAELALILNTLNQQQKSLDCYQKAVALEPNNPQLLFNLASLQRFMGQQQAAQTSLDKLIQLNPNDTEAWLLRSNLAKQTQDNHHLPALREALQQAHAPLAKAQLYYALGKELEDLAQYPESFQAWQHGARTRRANMQYSLDKDLGTLDNITKQYSKDVFQQNIQGCPSTQPIFILGLPRTGSTLVERIIGHHTDVKSVGELNNFALEMMKLVRATSSKAPANKAELIAKTKQIDFKQLGENYLKSTLPDTQNTPRFIDKLPLNSLYVGLIHLALPKAKIIYIQRHPMDTCLAIFKQIFTEGYPFSYDLTELARYQIAHYQLMKHWQQVLPGVIHTVHYEDLVDDITGQTKALLDFCELDWQPQCCEFEHNPAAATTASATQVRQPVYRSSVAKWQHFSKELSGVKTLFEQAGISCD
jgi:tetratricopeptide (TPR) repeat protein